MQTTIATDRCQYAYIVVLGSQHLERRIYLGTRGSQIVLLLSDV